MLDSSRLDSWKAIARYLGWEVRTVIRWERERGLPVHRIPGKGRPRVFAYTEELDRWLASTRGEPKPTAPMLNEDVPTTSDQPAQSASPETGEWGDRPGTEPQLRRGLSGWQVGAAVIAAGTIALGGLAIGWTFMRHVGPPRRLVAARNELQALDALGKAVWTHRFESGEIDLPGWTSTSTYFRDLDEDGREDVLATIDFSRPLSTQHDIGTVLRFSSDGKLLWSARADDRMIFRGGEYGPPWPAADLALYRTTGGATRIGWSVHHHTWWPGLLITLDSSGKRLGTFVNSGWIRAVRQSPDGRHLIVAGVTNSHGAYFVAALDAERPFGRSPEAPGSEFECVGCPPGDPVRYFVLPRSDVSREHPFPVEGPSVETFDDGRMQVHVNETAPPTIGATIYELSSDLNLRQARFSDSFWEWHRRLETEGKIGHSAENCPQRLGLMVQQWTPASGWESVEVAVR